METSSTQSITTSLFLICSNQPGPNLESFLYHRNKGQLKKVFLLADRYAKMESEHLKDFFSEIKEPGDCFSVSIVDMENTPTSVRQTLKKVIAQENLSGDITVNVTGGTKLMGFGVFGTPAHDRDKTRNVCFEYWDQKGRYELVQNERGIEINPSSESSATTDRLTADELFEQLPVRKVVSLSSDTEGYHWEEDSIPDLSLKQFGELTTRLSKGQWAWKTVWADLFPKLRLQDGHQLDSGLVFEIYTVNALRLLGVRNVALSMKKKSPDETMHAMELDVVFVSAGRVHLIDCKLGTSAQLQKIYATGGLLAQVHQASSQAQSIGGKFARTLLLRPRYTQNMGPRNKIARSMGAHILGMKECKSGFFQHLAKWIGVEISEDSPLVGIDECWRTYSGKAVGKEKVAKKKSVSKKAAVKPVPTESRSEKERFLADLGVDLANQNPKRKWDVFRDSNCIVIGGAQGRGLTIDQKKELLLQFTGIPRRVKASKTFATSELFFDDHELDSVFAKISALRRDRGLFEQISEISSQVKAPPHGE